MLVEFFFRIQLLVQDHKKIARRPMARPLKPLATGHSWDAVPGLAQSPLFLLLTLTTTNGTFQDGNQPTRAWGQFREDKCMLKDQRAHIAESYAAYPRTGLPFAMVAIAVPRGESPQIEAFQPLAKANGSGCLALT